MQVDLTAINAGPDQKAVGSAKGWAAESRRKTRP